MKSLSEKEILSTMDSPTSCVSTLLNNNEEDIIMETTTDKKKKKEKELMMDPLLLSPSVVVGVDVGGHVDVDVDTDTDVDVDVDTTATSNNQACWSVIPASSKSLRTTNPIRNIVDPIFSSIQTGAQRGDGKDPISLALGDPTEAGNSLVSPCPIAVQAVQQALSNPPFFAAGYLPACGCPVARQAIADFHQVTVHTTTSSTTTSSSTATVTSDHVIIANGCSGALELALTALLEGGNDNDTPVLLDNDDYADDDPYLDNDNYYTSSESSSASTTTSTTTTTNVPKRSNSSSSNNNNNNSNSSILLVPQPGFPLYTVIAESHGAQTRTYRLREDKDWQVDLKYLEDLILQENKNRATTSNNTSTTSRIRGIVINNPSNPTGAVYSRDHLQELVRLCERYQIPIVADEVYGDLVFDKSDGGGGDVDGSSSNSCSSSGHGENDNNNNNNINGFVPMAQVAADLGRHVPVITASGIGKQFLLPGWRVGWIVFHDNIYGSLQQVLAGAQRLAQIILGACHLPQKAIPALLSLSPSSSSSSSSSSSLSNSRQNPAVVAWKRQLVKTLQFQANLLCQELERAPGLTVLRPGGAMYTMIRIDIDAFDKDEIANDIEFARLLLKEENVIVLPGSCFGLPNYFRAVFCATPKVLQEAANRVVRFCQRHCKHQQNV